MDSEAFTRHWTKAQPVVAGYIASMVPDFHEAEDLLQNVAVVLLRKSGEYDPKQSFTGWALSMAKFEIMSRRRNHARSMLSFQPETVEKLAAASEELAPELEQRAAALRQCFQNVKGRAWELVSLRYEEELKPQQIAEKLGMAPVAVRVSLSRIRASLQECIQRRLNLSGRNA